MIVYLFARARELAGADTLDVPVTPPVSAVELRAALAVQCPALAPFLPRCLLAVNHQYADDEAIIPAGAEVAVIPPVSGGSAETRAVEASRERRQRFSGQSGAADE